MDKSYSVPYYAPSSQLPAPLPTIAEIEAGIDLYENIARRVVRVGSHFVVKYGAEVTFLEGETMLFMREVGATFVPEVYAIFSHPTAKGKITNFIVMEHIPGRTLKALWPELDSQEKGRITNELRSMFKFIRDLPAPGYFGSIGKRPVDQELFALDVEYGSTGKIDKGPFDTAHQFMMGLIERFSSDPQKQHKAAFYKRMLPLVLRHNTPKFTHGTFQQQNVIIRDNGEVYLIDWEYGGWYPEYWEYAFALLGTLGWRDDWHEHIAQILQEFPVEFPWIEIMYKETAWGY